MPKNRLKLNFELENALDRSSFIQEYLPTLGFSLNEHEVETIANYLLWGKDQKGRNVQQSGEIELKKWASTPVESLEALAETPGFQESSLRPLTEPPTRIQRTTFNRQAALDDAPEHLKTVYNDLFRQIDELELELNYYELWVGKRKLPPRAKLEAAFTEEERTLLNTKALKLSQFKYLKLRHLLVDLRSQQYIYYDTYKTQALPHTGAHDSLLAGENTYIGEDVSVYPVGLKDETNLSARIFNLERDPEPHDFNEDELWKITKLLWKPQTRQYIDFTQSSHVLNVYLMRAGLEDASEQDRANIYGAADRILRTLEYYETRANLTSLQKDLLELKLRNVPNLDIAKQLNKTYHKSYNENYISTIFHQKIIPSVADAAKRHREILENIFFPENFKKCKDCGRILLMNGDNFVKQKKSSDGYSPRCKQCEKLKRSRYK